MVEANSHTYYWISFHRQIRAGKINGSGALVYPGWGARYARLEPEQRHDLQGMHRVRAGGEGQGRGATPRKIATRPLLLAWR